MTPYVSTLREDLHKEVGYAKECFGRYLMESEFWTDGHTVAPCVMDHHVRGLDIRVAIMIEPKCLKDKTLFDGIHEVPPKPDVRGYALSQLQTLYPFSEGAYRIPLNGLKPNSLQGALIDVFRGKGDRKPYYTGYRIRTTRAKDAIFINIWKNDESADH